MVSSHKNKEKVDRVCTLELDFNKTNTKVTMAQRRDGDKQGNERGKVRIEDTNSAERSGREMAECAARYVSDSRWKKWEESPPFMSSSS